MNLFVDKQCFEMLICGLLNNCHRTLETQLSNVLAVTLKVRLTPRATSCQNKLNYIPLWSLIGGHPSYAVTIHKYAGGQ